MQIDRIIEELADAGVYLAVQDGKLVCKAKEGALTTERRHLIGSRKADFIAYLGSGPNAPASDEPPLRHREGGTVVLSPTQRRLWFLDRLIGAGANYIVPVTYRLSGPLDAAVLRRALQRVVDRHESLRTVIGEHDGEPQAQVRNDVSITMDVESLEGLDASSRHKEVRARLQATLADPFDLARELPLRVRLFRLAPEEHVLMLTFHHIATDGWSVENLLRELSALYTAFLVEQPDPLPPPTLQYGDYAAWQREWLAGERLQRPLDYWRQRLADAPRAHGLPLDRPRGASGVSLGGSWRQRLPPSLHRALVDLGRRHGSTLFMTLQAAFAVLVARWSGESEVVIGTPVANRPRQELAPLIGFFANTLALRSTVANDATFAQVLAQTRQGVLDAFEFQQLPFEMLVETLNPSRSLNIAPLVQIMFSLQDIDEAAALALPGVAVEAIVPDSVSAKFDINLSLLETDDGLEACWDYSRELFHTETVASMGASFETLLHAIAHDPTQRIDALPLLGKAERERVLALGNGAAHDYPEHICLHELIERQATQAPNATAIVQDDIRLGYGQLNRDANRLARHLRRLGVGPDVPVAVVMERRPAQITSLLAVLKAGGCYVPMELDYPEERLRYLLADSAPRVVITQATAADTVRRLVAALPDLHNVTVLDLDSDARAWMDEDTGNLPCAEIGLSSSHLAYVIYTSGSTGRPKGVMNEHRAIVNRLLWMQDAYPHGTHDKVLQKTPVGFDISVREIFLTLLAGAQLVLARPDGHKDPAYLVDLIGRERITIIGFVPSMLQAFLEHPRVAACNSVTRIFSGGETLPAALVRRCRDQFPQARLHNLYGPTEAAVSVTAWDCPNSALPDVIPIGKPGSNVRIYLLDEQGRLVPRGMRGEIHIAGRQVARGYFNREALSAERFVRDPFHEGADARMYRTGDLGRQLPDGHIEYLGRNDFQVKIRGQRVELGEIEAQALACPWVKQAAVVVHDRGQGDQRLVAYVVPADADMTEDAFLTLLRSHLQTQLPQHMVPAAYVRLDRLPVTANGKLETKALPPVDFAAAQPAEHEPPAGPVEQQLADMWRDLLKHEQPGVTLNFFDLGGHSLLLTRLHNRIGVHFAIELPLRELFAAQTIGAQAVLIETWLQQGGTRESPIPSPRPKDVPATLSFAQQRLWFIDQMGDAGAVYNIPCVLRLVGPLNIEALQSALQTIVLRHEVLRMSLRAVRGEATPQLIDAPQVTLPIEDLSFLDETARAQELRWRLDAEATRAFDLSADILLRAQLLRLSEGEHIFMLTLHHIAADGWSMAVLLQELATLYEATHEGRPDPLPSLPLQYADYARWQQQWLQGERLDRQVGYWQQQLADLPLLHNLPLDFPRPESQHYRGAMHWRHMPAALLDGVKNLARSHDATLFMAAQAAFAVLLARWSGDTDIVMGTPIANRRHEQLTPLIGFFVNTLVLRSDLSANPRFSDALTAAKATALDAYQHQDVPFEMLVDRLRPQRSTNHSPLFQVMLALDNNASAIVPFGGLQVSDAAGESHHAKFDLTLNLRETPEGLETCWDYNRDLFRADTIARMAESFEALLEGVAVAPETRIQQLPLLKPGAAGIAWESGEQRPLPPVMSVHELFEANARSAPDADAVREGQRALNYAELDRRANRVAQALLGFGVAPDTRVAIHAERGIDVVVGTLAVLKAGGAYVPLDPAHPRERLAEMIEDSGATVLLTQQCLHGRLATAGVRTMVLDDASSFAHQSEDAPCVPALRRDHLAYVIYTSGSTGKPKGVMVEHASLLSMIDDTCRRFADHQPIQAAWWGSYGFDVSVFEILLAMAQGATLHVVPEDVRADADAYLSWLCGHRITQAYLPPFFVRRLRERSDADIAALSLRRILVGVESLAEDELHRLRRLLPALLVVNAYGPTETTVYSTCYTDIRDIVRQAPIGRPIANTRVMVLDDALQPIPAGVVGEIHIGGIGVARGYLNRPDLTAERFVHDAHGERLYKTGDLGRWLPDGQLEFRGRHDQQIKLRGVRIEPGEIEAALCAHADIEDAVVVARQEHGYSNRQLVAYVTSREGRGIGVDVLREHLIQRLPAYMVPAAFVQLAALPLTVSGKLDAKALPAPDMQAYSTSDHVPPDTELEHRIAAMWQELLNHERISMTANFFDLGGHSLNAVRLMSSIREATGKALPISIIFKAPTIRALAAQVESYVDAADDSFVVLREGSGATPLFVFHAAGGDVLCYQTMLRYLAPDMPVYGFHRSELPNQRVPAFTSTEQLADDYVARLVQQQPTGPYHLAGWSSGGLVAMEVASRLEALGHTVAAVALIDTMLATGSDLPASFHQRGLSRLQQLDAHAACDLMREYEPSLPPVTPKDGRLDVSATDYFAYLVAANQISLDFHQPNFSLRARVHYFGCLRNCNFKSVEQRISELQRLVQQDISREDFDATHFSIMEEPGVAQMGKAMARLLDVSPEATRSTSQDVPSPPSLTTTGYPA
jgi:amino acid adenylation domain-containing protein